MKYKNINIILKVENEWNKDKLAKITTVHTKIVLKYVGHQSIIIHLVSC